MMTRNPWIAYNIIRLPRPVLLMLDRRDGTYLAVEGEWGIAVHDLMSGSMTFSQVCDKFIEKYGIASRDRIEANINALLSNLERRGILSYDTSIKTL